MGEETACVNFSVQGQYDFLNDLEGLMVSELESFVHSKDIAKHKHLRDDLPDLDFAILDRGRTIFITG